MYATDRVTLDVNGIDYGGQLNSVSWSLSNNAKPEDTMTNNRITQVVTLGNLSGSATIVETIIQGTPTIDWFSFNWNDAILTVHPASDTYQAPTNMIVYNGQARILTVLAVDGEEEDYPRVGQGATRTIRLLLANATYQ